MNDLLSIVTNTIYEIAQKDKNAYFVCIDGFENIVAANLQKICPERFIKCGIGEANSLSVASGIALSGKTVFVFIMGMYASTRALEQLRIDVGYNNANVKVIAFKPGLKFNADAGYSHWNIEDIAIVRTVPNIKILNPATKDELSAQLEYAYKTNGAFYIRLENLHSDFNPQMDISFNKMPKICSGRDVAIIAEGSMVEYTFGLQKELKHANIQSTILNASILKPFDKDTVINLIDRKIPIITIEEQINGGIGSIVSEIIAEHGRRAKFLPIRINNENYNIVGKYDYVSNKLMDLSNTLNKIIKFADKKYSLLGLPVIKVKSKLRNNVVGKLYLQLFGLLPLLKIKYRNKIRKGKPRIKVYLFGFIRIV